MSLFGRLKLPLLYIWGNMGDQMKNIIPSLDELSSNNHQDWLDAIQNSLKSGKIEELYTEYQNIKINPFTPAENFDKDPLSSTKRDWFIGVKIPQSSPAETNQQILYFLENGAQAIRCQSTDSKTTLQGVHLDMIYLDGISKVTSLNTHEVCLKSEAENLTEELTEICNQLKAELKTGRAIDQIKLTIKIEPHLAIAISKLRAIRILWLNILEAHNLELAPAFIVADIFSSKPDPNNALIELSSLAMYAALGNCDLIYLDAASFDNNQRRIAMNIQHIMKIESKLHLTDDPLAGAYSVETLTEQIATQVWDRLSI